MILLFLYYTLLKISSTFRKEILYLYHFSDGRQQWNHSFVAIHFISQDICQLLGGPFKFIESQHLHNSEAVAQRCSVKKVFLEISQNSQENTCARDSFLIKLQA